MLRFIVDANLPENISIWNGEEFVHVNSIDKKWKDGQIWNYAKDKNLIIISKDSDFGNRIKLVSPPPKVIHFRTGNMLLEEFEKFVLHNWDSIMLLLAKHKLVIVYTTYLEAIA